MDMEYQKPFLFVSYNPGPDATWKSKVKPPTTTTNDVQFYNSYSNIQSLGIESFDFSHFRHIGAVGTEPADDCLLVLCLFGGHVFEHYDGFECAIGICEHVYRCFVW